MIKYCVCFTCYRKVGRYYENQISMSFVVAESKEAAYECALSQCAAEILANNWKISTHIEMEVPEQFLENEIERIKFTNNIPAQN